MRKRSVLKSMVAGALIGFADAAPMSPLRLHRPLGVVWLDDRDLPDPLDGVPLMLLDPVPLSRQRPDRRFGLGPLRVALHHPLRLLHRLRHHLTPD